MRKDRLYHSIRLLLLRSPWKRAQYMKKRKLFNAIGENCGWGPWLLPLYAKLIRLHDNVYIHKTAKLIPHDMINRFLMATAPECDLSAKERLGCIEIMDNVYICANVTILPNVRINKNCIISTGSVVASDIPEGSIVAGNPAKVIGSFDAYLASRIMHNDQYIVFKNQELPDVLVEVEWDKFRKMRGGVKDATPKCKAANGIEASQTESSIMQMNTNGARLRTIEAKITELLSFNVDGVDFIKENLLIDNNILDSLDLVTIVSLLEDTFSCKIPFQDVNAHNFNSVRSMAALIENLSVHDIGQENSHKNVSPKTDWETSLDVKDAGKPIVQRILEYALEHPEDNAIIANDKETTYWELANMIISVYNWLKSEGIKKGDSVIVQAMHEDICIACYYGTHLLGAKLVPVEKSASSFRILDIAKDTKSRLIISMKSDECDIRWVNYDHVRSIVSNKVFDKDTLMEYPDLDLPCEMIFTTGTTGKSKGVLMTQRHMSWYAYSVAKCVEMKKGNRFLLTTPLNHAGGLRRTHLLLANGGCMVYLDGMSDLGKYFNYIEKYKVTSLYLPPVTIRILMTRTGDELTKYKDQIDFVYSSSSPLPAGDCEALRKLLPNTRLYNAYEASETPGVSAYNYNTDHILDGCLGKANEGVELAILLEDGTITKEPEKQGQICVKSKMNMQEYYLEPELTESVMLNGWFVSNDLGHLDTDGNIYYSGRKGDVINIGGYKIAPTDVEEVALLSGLINECICIEGLDEYSVPFIKLLVVVPDKEQFDSKELNKFISSKLEAYKVPRKIEVVDAVKKTFNGKIDRKAYR